MTRAIHLLIIDPQNDFCDLPAAYLPPDLHSGGTTAPALPVAGAHADMERLAAFIHQAGQALTHITVTLDSHQQLDVAHPGFWQRAEGGAVPAFTPITAAQVRAGEFTPRDPGAQARTLHYLDELESRGRHTLMVWPVHCEIGTWGHNVHADVHAAYNAWEVATLRNVAKVTKGENPGTEHYSAVMAEVPMDEDPSTQLNEALIADLDRADLLLIAGEAGSHCVRATTEHLAAHLRGPLTRLVLLTDCMSPVGGFEAQHQAFLDSMRALGVQLMTSTEALQRLAAPAAH